VVPCIPGYCQIGPSLGTLGRIALLTRPTATVPRDGEERALAPEQLVRLLRRPREELIDEIARGIAQLLPVMASASTGDGEP